jgi:hypothetical protein
MCGREEMWWKSSLRAWLSISWRHLPVCKVRELNAIKIILVVSILSAFPYRNLWSVVSYREIENYAVESFGYLITHVVGWVLVVTCQISKVQKEGANACASSFHFRL